MYATKIWKDLFLSWLPYGWPLSEWDRRAATSLESWVASPFDVQIKGVRQLWTPHRGFYDYDLAATVLATTPRVWCPPSYCEGDLVVDASIGLHVTNTGNIADGMFYGQEVMVLTQRCYNGHPGHSASWLVPPGAHGNAVRQRLMLQLGGGYWTKQLQLPVVIETLRRHISRR